MDPNITVGTDGKLTVSLTPMRSPDIQNQLVDDRPDVLADAVERCSGISWIVAFGIRSTSASARASDKCAWLQG